MPRRGVIFTCTGVSVTKGLSGMPEKKSRPAIDLGVINQYPIRRKPPMSPGPGRPKGSVDKVSRDLKAGILNGAISHGSDGAGAGGLDGFLAMCAARHPKHYMMLLGKLLPHVISGQGLGGNVAVSFNITSLPSGTFLSAESIERLKPEMQLIEHDASPSAPEPDEFDNMSDDELMRAAGLDVDQS
jgi:hypothetical protein